MEGWNGAFALTPLPTAPLWPRRWPAGKEFLAGAGVETQVETVSVDSLASRLPDCLAVGPAQMMTFEPAATEAAASVKSLEGLSADLYGVGATAVVVAALDQGALSAVAAWSDYARRAIWRWTEPPNWPGRAERKEPPPFFLIRGEDIYEPDNQKLLFPVTS